MLQAIELISGMEEWMKSGNHALEELDCLADAIDYFITVINFVLSTWCNGNKIAEKSLILPPPYVYSDVRTKIGWNSAPNESHHKTEVKAPACTTQKDDKSIIEQRCKRYSELRAIKHASEHYNIS